jgi:hypothetical protein
MFCFTFPNKEEEGDRSKADTNGAREPTAATSGGTRQIARESQQITRAVDKEDVCV